MPRLEPPDPARVTSVSVPPVRLPDPPQEPKVEGVTVLLSESPPLPEPTESLPEDDDVLAGLGALIAEARRDKADKSRQDAVVDALSRLTVKDFPQIAEHPVIAKFLEGYHQAQAVTYGRRPGEVINKGTLAENAIPWTLRDLKSPPPGWNGTDALPPGHTQWVFNVVPESSREVIVNGIKVRFYRRVPYSGPKVFYDVYLQAMDQEEAASQHAAFMMKAEGAGVPQDPTILNEGTLAVRTSFTKGTYYPGMGMQGMTAPTVAAEGEGEAAT